MAADLVRAGPQNPLILDILKIAVKPPTHGNWKAILQFKISGKNCGADWFSKIVTQVLELAKTYQEGACDKKCHRCDNQIVPKVLELAKKYQKDRGTKDVPNGTFNWRKNLKLGKKSSGRACDRRCRKCDI